MLIAVKQFLGLPVVTKSGQKLGRVVNCLIETESQNLSQYEVKPSLLTRQSLLINRNQVIIIEKDKIIVEDSVAPQSAIESVPSLGA